MIDNALKFKLQLTDFELKLLLILPIICNNDRSKYKKIVTEDVIIT